MNREKGFATIFGLCLILVIVLIAKGIQEAEMNYAYEVADFKEELDLQNAADSGIYEAAELVRDELDKGNRDELDKGNQEILPINRNSYLSDSRKNNQVRLLKKTFTVKNGDFDEDIEVEVWGERIMIRHFEQIYPSYDIIALSNNNDERFYTLISKAELQSRRMNGKIYRRSFAYVLLKNKETEGENGETIIKEVSDTTIHFMALPSSKD